jgi:hypothetical protein
VLIAAAVCPHPPLLIPGASGASPVIEDVRAACEAAVTGLLASGPDLVVVVGGGADTARYDPAAAGSLREYGIPWQSGSGRPVLPLSLTIGAWLLRRYRRQTRGSVALQAVRGGAGREECLRLGARLAALAPRVALLAMGDGTARRAIGVPGARDPAAEAYDAGVAAALEAADPARLARLDPAQDAELLVAGRAAWQVLAGAAGKARLRGRLLCAVAPYDVTYLVAAWDAGQAGGLTCPGGRRSAP